MDKGLPISYRVLQVGTAVQAAGGEFVGTVERVDAAPEQDIFEGIVLRTVAGTRFVPAEDIASLHERGVELKIDTSAVEALPQPTARAAPPPQEDASSGWHGASSGLGGYPPGRPGRPWFGPKRFGFGYRPQTWQGYLVMLALVAVSLVLRTAGSGHHSNLSLLLILPAIIIPLLMRGRGRP